MHMTEETIEMGASKNVIRRYIRTLARYERLMEISRTLNSTLELDSLLEYIVASARDLTDTEAASIMLISRDGDLRFEASLDLSGLNLDSIAVPLDNSIAGWVVTHSEPLVIADVRNEPRWSRNVDEQTAFETRNMLAVPMRTHNKTIGCLEALNKHDNQPFTDEDVNVLTTLAAQAAVAVENARLFEQSDLIAEMVHELRTPLAAIKATTHIILRPELSEEKRRSLVDTIATETNRLTRMTTEFLDLARLESGRTRLQRKPVDLRRVLEEAANTVSHQASDRDLTLEVVVDPPDLPAIIGDAEKLMQVVLNLATNAIKYNKPGGSVWLRAIQDGPTVRVEVQDTGLGISPENVAHMFEKFYRVADTEGYTQGTGLGLAIAKQIVEGHRGQIGVESEPGVGTTFWFALPIPEDTIEQ
jgi:signal transduction histidine kinase